VLEKNHWAD